MATIPIQPIEAIMTTTGGPPYILHLLEAASQTFLKGAVLTLNHVGGGYVQEATSPNPANIVGVATEPASNTATNGLVKVGVALAIPSNIFEANLDTAQVTAILDIGRTFGIEKIGNFWTIDKSGGTGNRKALIQDIPGTVGDTTGRVRFTFHVGVGSFSYTS